MRQSEKNVTKEQWTELVERSKAGDASAFEELYRFTINLVEKECAKNLQGHRSDVDDAVNDAYLNMWLKIHQLETPEAFPGWARRIAHNTACSMSDSRRRKSGKDECRPLVSSEEHEGLDTIPEVENADISPEYAVDQDYLKEIMEEALAGLNEKQRKCLEMHNQGMQYQEIAEKLDMPLGSVKSSISYGKKRMQEKLREIEERDGVRIHGVAGAPLTAEWIHAESAELSPAEQKLWKKISRKLAHEGTVNSVTGAGAGIGTRITAGIAAVAIVAGGTAVIVHYTTKDDTTTVAPAASITVTATVADAPVTEGEAPSGTVTTVSRTTTRTTTTANAGNQARNNTRTTARETTTAPTTTETTTRRMVTNSNGTIGDMLASARARNQ